MGANVAETDWFEGRNEDKLETIFPYWSLIAAVFVGIALALAVGSAWSIQLNQNGCVNLAIWERDIIWARDMGADKAKVKAYISRPDDEAPDFFPIVLRHFESLWATQDDRTEVMKRTFQECIDRRGTYGTDT